MQINAVICPVCKTENISPGLNFENVTFIQETNCIAGAGVVRCQDENCRCDIVFSLHGIFLDNTGYKIVKDMDCK